jgi:hypothetical protein
MGNNNQTKKGGNTTSSQTNSNSTNSGNKPNPMTTIITKPIPTISNRDSKDVVNAEKRKN